MTQFYFHYSNITASGSRPFNLNNPGSIPDPGAGVGPGADPDQGPGVGAGPDPGPDPVPDPMTSLQISIGTFIVTGNVLCSSWQCLCGTWWQCC